jgi:eukaryotic-like serine/threonine-protein kinase
VVLADARADSADSVESDVRAVGGLLYFALTGTWPHTEIGKSALPDAHRDASGALITPRQVRAGVPAYLDDLTMDLLDPRVAAPEADALTAELARLDAADEEYEDVGPLRFTQNATVEPARSTRKIVVGVGALVVIAILGLIFGIRAITSSNDHSGGKTTQANVGAGTDTTSDGSSQAAAPTPKKIPLTADMVRIVDPPNGTRADTGEAAYTVDNDSESAWETQGFNDPFFGHLKPGMGVLINLGTPKHVADVRVETNAPGAAIDIRTGPNDPGNNSTGDQKVYDTFKKVNDGDTEKGDGTRRVFDGFNEDTTYQYLLVWVSELPKGDGGKYRISVTNIEVDGY